MGTDIHCIGQIKIDGQWTNCNFDNIPKHRDYQLFAVMADVRNGIGFGGCDTGNAVEPISKPKGFFEDIHKIFKKERDYMHSFSWLNAKEIFDYRERNQEIKIIKRGVVDPSEYQTFKKYGYPNSWCGGVSGRTVKMISNSEMENIIKHQNETSNVDYYTKIEWKENLIERLGYFFYDLLNEMISALGDNDNLEDVRLSFCFDN